MKHKIAINLLKKRNIDAWLIYQSQGTYPIGMNPIASEICEITELITRPWFCLLKNNLKLPIWIYQSMESDKFKNVLGKKIDYSSRASLVSILSSILPSQGSIAMEISSKANIPLLSRVDYGTVKLIQSLTRAKIVSSQDLLGELTSKWGKIGLNAHKEAVCKLNSILDDTKLLIKSKLGRITDYQVQKYIESRYEYYKLQSIYHPVVASGKNTGNPHYFPSANKPVTIRNNDILLIDIWGKTNEPKSIYADITTMYFTGKTVPNKISCTWSSLIYSRDAVVKYLQKNVNKKIIKGSDLDKIARKLIRKTGYEKYFIHRLGHNISSELHGYGPNLDSYETIDNRSLLFDSGYSVEPGIYTSKFGLRSEINIYISKTGIVTVTTPAPLEIEKI